MAIDSPRIHSAFVLAGMIIFFPVGIVLLIIRFVLHRKYNHLRAKDYRLIGHSFMALYALIAAFVLSMSNSPTWTPSDAAALLIVFGVLFVLPAITFYIVGASRKKKMNVLYSQYYHLVTVQGIETMARLSELTGQTVRNVTQDISYMIASGKLADARLDPANGLVKMGSRSGTSGNSSESPMTATRAQIVVNGTTGSPPPAPAAQSVTCSGCGSSSNVIPGQSQECEFCGNALFVSA